MPVNFRSVSAGFLALYPKRGRADASAGERLPTVRVSPQARRRKRLVAIGVTLLSSSLSFSCDRSGKETMRPPAPPPVFGTGSVSGKVLFQGKAPARQQIDVGICHPGEKLLDETVIVAENGGLQNAVVYLKNAPRSAASQPPALLDQVRCQYVPHVVALQVGQVLRVKTSDPTIHNVHVMSRENPAVNVAMTGDSAPKDLTFSAPEFQAVRCDVHPWMLAHIAVFEHPFFGVTDAQGHFDIPRVPDGSYTLAVWHEALGARERPVVVENGKTVSAEIAYEEPK